jgi:hypothetical protein
MATESNRRKVLSLEEKVKMMRQIGNEKKKKTDICRKFGLVILRSKRFGNTHPKLLVRKNRTD